VTLFFEFPTTLFLCNMSSSKYANLPDIVSRVEPVCITDLKPFSRILHLMSTKRKIHFTLQVRWYVFVDNFPLLFVSNYCRMQTRATTRRHHLVLSSKDLSPAIQKNWTLAISLLQKKHPRNSREQKREDVCIPFLQAFSLLMAYSTCKDTICLSSFP